MLLLLMLMLMLASRGGGGFLRALLRSDLTAIYYNCDRVSVTLTDGSVRAGRSRVRPGWSVYRTTDEAGPGLVELQFVARSLQRVFSEL